MPLFYVVKVWPREAGREPHPCDYETDGSPALYATGEEAAARVAEINPSSADFGSHDSEKAYFARYGKAQVRVFPGANDAWRDREAARFADGTYAALPWAEESWFKDSLVAGEHFAHVSKREPGKVAFTENPVKGAADRQTRMLAGRYLQRYFESVLSSREIRTLSTAFSAQYELNQLHFATTSDEIYNVYRNGPESCMSHSPSSYESPVHPVRMYAAGDLAVAFIKDDNDHITARAVCWPAKKVYSRLYGDEMRLDHLLQVAGYTHGIDGEESECFHGARLVRRECAGGFVVPYVDWHSSAQDCGDFLRIDSGGDISLQESTGVSGDHRVRCSHCGGRMGEETGAYVEGCGEWCESCVENDSVWCECVDERHPAEDCSEVENDQWVPDRRLDRYTVTCAETGARFMSDSDAIVTLADGRTVSRDWAEENCTENDDGELVPIGEDDDSRGSPGSPRVAKPGRDESPDQLEMALSTSAPGDFRAGDTVRCIDDGRSPHLTVNREYVVVAVDRGFLRLQTDNGKIGGWYASRFVLVVFAHSAIAA